jgi:hypothetical protein
MLAVEGTETKEVAKLIMAATEPAGRHEASKAAHTSYPSLDPAMVLLQSIVIGHNFSDATRGLGEPSRWLYPGATGTGASGAHEVGRPGYLMSCELALLSGRPCDQPGCAVSANP